MILNRPSVVQSRVSTANTPIQQIKSAGLTSRGRTTQGLPQVVSNISVSVSKSGDNNDSRTLRVSFTENTNDPYFTGVNLYMKQGNGNPTLIATGTSPIIVTIPKSNSPAIITLASNGNWGTTHILTSPGKAVSLA